MKYAERELVFIRGRVCQHASNVASMKGSKEWMIIPVDAGGRDINGGGVLFVGEESIVSIAEAKKIVREAVGK